MVYNILFSAFLFFFGLFQANASPMEESLPFSSDSVKIGDKSVILIGSNVTTGLPAPDFQVVNERFKPVGLNDFGGKILLLNIIPSIDTGVGSLQARHFENELISLGSNVVILTISTDSPFAQKRFSNNEQIDRQQLLSDAVWRDFGHNYGLLIKDMGILARALLVIDQQGVVAYKQLVPQLSQQPDYTAAVAVVKALSGNHVADNHDKSGVVVVDVDTLAR